MEEARQDHWSHRLPHPATSYMQGSTSRNSKDKYTLKKDTVYGNSFKTCEKLGKTTISRSVVVF
jgi:hypothetical protein